MRENSVIGGNLAYRPKPGRQVRLGSGIALRTLSSFLK
jgi:hypothetical protein